MYAIRSYYVDENVRVELGKSTTEAGISSFNALDKATSDLQKGYIDALITAPINKDNRITSYNVCYTKLLRIESSDQINDDRLTQADRDYISFRLEKEGDCTIQKWPHLLFFKKAEKPKEKYLGFEAARVAGAKFFEVLKDSYNFV